MRFTRARLSGVGPPWNRLQPRVRPLQEEIVGGSRFALTLLLGAVLVVLAITCANVANLLLARASARQREIALRMSVGGGPLRILRQLFFESMTFAAIGGVAGVALSYGLLNVVMRVASDAVPRLSEATVDAIRARVRRRHLGRRPHCCLDWVRPWRSAGRMRRRCSSRGRVTHRRRAAPFAPASWSCLCNWR